MQRAVIAADGSTTLVDLPPEEVAEEEAKAAAAYVSPLDLAKRRKQAAVSAEYRRRLALGMSVGDLHVDIDDGARANFSGMAVTASFVISGLMEWPADYARGWVSMEGARIPLPTSQDGVVLAASAGAFYAALVQRERDLIDALAAAADEAAVAAIDITAGWP
jgi:hypothetical protein